MKWIANSTSLSVRRCLQRRLPYTVYCVSFDQVIPQDGWSVFHVLLSFHAVSYILNPFHTFVSVRILWCDHCIRSCEHCFSFCLMSLGRTVNVSALTVLPESFLFDFARSIFQECPFKNQSSFYSQPVLLSVSVLQNL